MTESATAAVPPGVYARIIKRLLAMAAWREQVAVRRRAFRDERYWAGPVPGWGSERARLLIVGLAPAAHGGNRAGRIFTGDRRGDFLFASLWLLSPQPAEHLHRPRHAGHARHLLTAPATSPAWKPEGRLLSANLIM